MYNDQTATVRTDASSRSFSIQRGVKRGDPLSSFLFNALLEHIFRQIKPGWQRKKFGIKLGFAQETSITNLRFADDVLLYAPNLRQLTCLLRDLKNKASCCGLSLRPDKTNILTNVSRRAGRTIMHIVLDGARIDIRPNDQSTKYLGKKLSFHDFHGHELKKQDRRGMVEVSHTTV
jgi:hypothetical protein